MHTKRLMSLVSNSFFWLSMVVFGVGVFSPALSQAQQSSDGHAPGRPHAGEHLIFDDENVKYCLKQELALSAGMPTGNQGGVDAPGPIDDYNSRCAQFYFMLPAGESESAARLVLIHAPFTPGARMLQQKLSLLCRQRPGLMTSLCPVVGCTASTC